MADGEFELGGKPYSYEILEIQTYDGESYTGPEMGDHIQEADRVFYSVDDPTGETYYRWLGGPFENIEDVESAIEDDTDAYE
jgi:hypothetical protein